MLQSGGTSLRVTRDVRKWRDARTEGKRDALRTTLVLVKRFPIKDYCCA